MTNDTSKDIEGLESDLWEAADCVFRTNAITDSGASRSLIPEYAHVTGVAQPRLTQANLNRIPVVVPTRLLRDEFQHVVATRFSQRFVLQAQNDRLRAARDLLLPRLMSGGIAV
jgi:hypothetical protein